MRATLYDRPKPAMQMVGRIDNLYDLLHVMPNLALEGEYEVYMATFGVDHTYCQRIYENTNGILWEFINVPDEHRPHVPFHYIEELK